MRKFSTAQFLFSNPETVDLNQIIASYELELVIIAGLKSTPSEETVSSPVQWVHSSDLRDPTAFLTPRTVLLTTGTQFQKFKTKKEYQEYVRKLLKVGVTALGFGVDIVYDKIPPQLIDACDELQLPLFRVPFDTPFIQISIKAASLLAAKTYEKETWSLEIQRQISRAALRGRGIYAALDTYSKKVNRWAALATDSGTVTYLTPEAPQEITAGDNISAAARALLKTGYQINTSKTIDEQRLHLQTIPGSKGSVGVLIIEGSEAFENAERGIIEFLTALASIYLEQQKNIIKGQSQIQNSIFELLLGHQTELAAETMIAAEFGELATSSRVCFLGPKENLEQKDLEVLRGFVKENPGSILVKHGLDSVLVTPSAALKQLIAKSENSHIPVGISRPSNLSDPQKSLDEARIAYQISISKRTPETATVYTQEKTGSMIELLRDNEEAQRRARLLLEPIRQYDRNYSENLEETLRVWLMHHGQNAPTANFLAVHRHTIANRIKLIFDLLKRDPADPLIRAECLNALTLTTAK